MDRISRIAVCSRSFSARVALREQLGARYSNVQYNDTGEILQGDDLRQFVSCADAVIVGLEKVDSQLLDKVRSIKVVSKYGVGLDSIDLRALADRNVKLGWRPGVNKRSVTELALCFALTLLRHIHVSSLSIRSGRWQPIVGNTLSETTVGIIGCGNVGKDFARTLRYFGATVLITDVLPMTDFCEEIGCQQVGLEELMTRARIVSLHVPLTNSTKHIINAKTLNLMAKGSYLINCARGGLVDEDSLLEHLECGWIAGAAFDVFNTEPPANVGLTTHLNFLGTPHIGGSTEEAINAMGIAAIEGLSANFLPDEQFIKEYQSK